MLRADRRLALALDGVYRRGEFYLRWMQRLSSLGFGTHWAGFLTRFAVVPFGGAFVAVVGVLRNLGTAITGGKDGEGTSPAACPNASCLAAWAVSDVPVQFRGISPGVSAVSSRRLSRSFQRLAVEPIRWIVHSPVAAAVLRSRLFTLVFRLLVKPLIWTARRLVPSRREIWWRHIPSRHGAVVFLAINLLLNSRIGRTAEEVVVDGIVEGWRRFGLRLITGSVLADRRSVPPAVADRRAADVQRRRVASFPQRREPRPR